jgi:hypothetical protein
MAYAMAYRRSRLVNRLSTRVDNEQDSGKAPSAQGKRATAILSSDEAILEVVTELIELERRLLQVLATLSTGGLRLSAAYQPHSSTITQESPRETRRFTTVVQFEINDFVRVVWSQSRELQEGAEVLLTEQPDVFLHRVIEHFRYLFQVHLTPSSLQ